MVHFSAVRTHPKDGLLHTLQEKQVNVGYRDELYRTGRDVAEESNFRENIQEIDRYLVYIAARGIIINSNIFYCFKFAMKIMN